MILTWLFPPSTGGIEANAYRLAKNLSEKNNVSVFTAGKKYKGEEKEGFRVFRVQEMDPAGLKAKGYATLFNRMKNVLKNEHIDVVLSYNLSCLSTTFSKTLISAIEGSGVPLIEYCGDARYKNLNKNLVNEFKQILAVSNFVRDRLIKIGYDKRRVRTVYNGVPTELFDSKKYSKNKSLEMFGLPKNKKIIVFPSRAIRGNGQFNRQKGFLTIINSLKEVRNRTKIDFVVVFPMVVGRKDKNPLGEKNLAKLKLKLKKNGLDDNVIFIERRIPVEEMPFLYKTADIVLTPSVNEALGTVFLESLSMGIPAIGAKSGGIPEVIVNRKTGFTIKPGDSKDLAKKIVKLLDNEKLRSRMGKNSRKRALKVFHYEKMVCKLKKIFRKAVK